MEYKDYYAMLGLESTATPDEIKRAYRKLARKYHPDVSKDPDGEARFKEIAEAYAVLKDEEKKAAYDDIGTRYRQGKDREFTPPPGWDSGFEFSGADSADDYGAEHSDFFEAIFGARPRASRATHGSTHVIGGDHHAKVQIDLRDAYRGGLRTISLRAPQMDASGHVRMQERQLEVNIPKGIRAGQHLRLAGQGGPGLGGAPAGDLYLEIEFAPHPLFRVDGRDVYADLPVAPWEAALGANVHIPTPDGSVQLSVPPGSSSGRKLRLKGKGIPGNPPGDLYAVLFIALPPADTDQAKAAYRDMAKTFGGFAPRKSLEA